MTTMGPFAAFDDGRALAQAIVDTVREPLLVLDKELRVVAASRSFYETFQADRQETQGRLLYTLGDGQWDIPALRTLLEKVVPEHSVMDDYEVEHEFPKIGRRTMLLNARTVISEKSAHTALLLAIEDISERRAYERELEHLLRQKELLLEEMRHRIANSLQIIASILLLKARRVQSEETRGQTPASLAGRCRLPTTALASRMKALLTPRPAWGRVSSRRWPRSSMPASTSSATSTAPRCLSGTRPRYRRLLLLDAPSGARSPTRYDNRLRARLVMDLGGADRR